MGSHRHHTWTEVAALDEHLTVFLQLDEALENVLLGFASSSHEPYKIRTDSGSIDRPSRSQISDAVDSLGGSLRGLEVWYTGPDASRRVNLEVQPFAAWPLSMIGCSLQVFGDDENETNGRFDTLRNRMDAEIKRRWPKSTDAKQEIAPPPAATPTAPVPVRPSARASNQRLDGVLRHPIIAPLVVIGVIALIGFLWKALGG
jgi:hypothetical protein